MKKKIISTVKIIAMVVISIVYLFLVQSVSAVQITENVEFQINDTNATFVMSGNLTFDRIEVHASYLKLDNNTISVTPSVGTINITIINFTSNYKKWDETASNSGATVEHVIGNFPANTQILIKKDSVAWTGLTSNSTGYISFSYSGSYPVTFEVEAGTMPTTTQEAPSGGGYPIFKPSQERLEEGYEKPLRKNWKIQFEFDNETHTIKLDDIVNKTAIITVSSEPVTFNLTVNETEKLNLDGDNYYDLQVFLKDISDYEADLIVKLIHEEIPEICGPDWRCTEWSECVNYTQTRICTDLNNCNSTQGKPDEARSCCEPDWECSEWSECVSNIETRTCTDLSNCNVTEGRPDEVRGCEAQTGYLNILIVSGLIVAVAVLGFVVRKRI